MKTGTEMDIEEDFYETLQRMLARLSFILSTETAEDRREVMCLFAGLLVLKRLASKKAEPPEAGQLKKLNHALRTTIGQGHSWASCIQFLSGARARGALVTHRDFITKIGGEELVSWGDLILPVVAATGGYNGMLGHEAYAAHRKRYDEVFERNLRRSFERLNETMPGVFVKLDGEGVVRIHRGPVHQ